jgi:RNA polymerase-binding transcription factor DksA
MADELDHTAALSEVLDEARIAEARARNRPEQVQNPDGSWPTIDCIDCGDEIEKRRLALGKVRCILCQEDLEKRRKLGL